MNKNRHKVFKLSVTASIVFFVGALVACGFRQQAFAGHDTKSREPLRNYAVVWENKLTRSGLPYKDSGWQWLRDHGTNTIVTFRPQHDVDYEKFGFKRVLRIPLSGTQVPTDEQVNQFLAFIQDPANWPVDIHCSAGKDRTGMMAALARYAIDGWPMDKALAESRLYRDGHDLPEKRVAWLESWAANHKPGGYRSSNWKASAPAQSEGAR